MGEVRVASVCSGIGGAELAFAGIAQHTFAAEIEQFPRAVLAHHFPGMKLYADFTEIPAAAGPVDVLVGGTPCQSFSVAGLRGGMADARGNLALEFLRLAERVRARWVLWENVPGVLSSSDGRDFGAFVGGLAELGYGWAYRVLDAQYFGLAQRRRRVFVVGCLGDWRRAAAVLFEPSSLRGDTAPGRETREGIAGTLASRATAGGGLGTDFDLDGGLIAADLRNGATGDIAMSLQSGGVAGERGRCINAIPHVVARCLNAHGARIDGESETFVTHSLRAEGFDASEDGTGRGTPLVAAFNWQSGGDCRGLDPKDTVMALSREQTPAISGSAGRRLTPTECERLQGFPDGWTDVAYRGKPAADGPRYRALGNAFAVPVVRWIARRIVREVGYDG